MEKTKFYACLTASLDSDQRYKGDEREISVSYSADPFSIHGDRITDAIVYYATPDTAGEVAARVLGYKPGMKVKDFLTITKEEYDALPNAYKGPWDTERCDMENWADERENYMGKLTMLANEKGATVLLIEGWHFRIK